MLPRPHQEEGSTWALNTIREYGLAYLSWQERTGKTLTALLTVEKSEAKTCLIVTKKKAIEGWEETLIAWDHNTKFVVINYESIHKIKLGGKIAHYNISTDSWVNRDVFITDFDFIILDEAHHAIASIGKVSATWKKVSLFSKEKPILYLSATPYAETIGQLYHQFKLSDWSPWIKYSNYYNFHRDYGIPKTIYTSYGPQLDRSVFRVKEVLNTCEHLFNFKTRKEVGIEHEPSVNVVTVPMSTTVTDLMKEWKSKRVIEVNGYIIEGDSDPKMRSVHYQLEGGTLKISDTLSIFMDDMDKINYIKANYEPGTYAIMAHFIAERGLIERELGNVCRILSSDGDAEGTDLHKVDKLIVYSMSFKTSKHTQRICRQANHDREEPIEVDILVASKPGVGRAVYNTVAIKKENFVKASYERE